MCVVVTCVTVMVYNEEALIEPVCVKHLYLSIVVNVMKTSLEVVMKVVTQSTNTKSRNQTIIAFSSYESKGYVPLLYTHHYHYLLFLKTSNPST